VGIKVYSNEVKHPYPRRDNSKRVKKKIKILKKNLSKPANQFQSNFVQIILG
jgi:hypothetical protein